MRNPARKALYCLFALAAGAGLVWFGAAREQRIGEHMTAIVPILIGLAVAPFALVTFVQALFAVRGRARLRSGHRVIARWHVHPAEWDAFRGLDARRAGEHPALANDLWIRRTRPRDPVEVIVGETSLLVDDSYHVLRPGGLPELREVRWLGGPPTCLEFALLYPRGRYGGSVPLTLRVPVPASGREGARRVIAYFEPRLSRTPGLALRNPRLTYRVCAILFAAAAVMGAAGWALPSALPEGNDPLVPVAMLIVGVGLGAFALILAFATFLLTRPGSR